MQEVQYFSRRACLQIIIRNSNEEKPLLCKDILVIVVEEQRADFCGINWKFFLLRLFAARWYCLCKKWFYLSVDSADCSNKQSGNPRTLVQSCSDNSLPHNQTTPSVINVSI